jgi:hypothetical protein
MFLASVLLLYCFCFPPHILIRDLARIIIWRTLHDSSTDAMIATPGGMDCEVRGDIFPRFCIQAAYAWHDVTRAQVSIESIARDVAALAGVSHLLEFDSSKADGQFRKPASCEVLMSKLPQVRVGGRLAEALFGGFGYVFGGGI